ncbi:hypothetical protein Q4511_01150 [Paracoccus sp. 1_MG-2023]|uniref:hypothetical protein n=1 Tax=unclassified Paracoccus (in: a-proteobacteria) TaxID=2688777 RepID=UPI001C09F422|nr:MULTISPECIES: hypothetical protein [unclassified Paracoccus (in: a-proteobacteria)]MBU2957634.1 hypothetical protein [Paracoccus sp. C2R09]MDO6667519.1 hypothetical protein [Paracoccus sp. 1_MG-2023]
MNSRQLIGFARANWAALLILGCASAALIWFATGFALDLARHDNVPLHDQALKPWMTPRFVVMSYDLPREVVADVLELPPTGPGRLKLGTIAREMGVTMEELTERVRDAADMYHGGRP